MGGSSGRALNKRWQKRELRYKNGLGCVLTQVRLNSSQEGASINGPVWRSLSCCQRRRREEMLHWHWLWKATFPKDGVEGDPNLRWKVWASWAVCVCSFNHYQQQQQHKHFYRASSVYIPSRILSSCHLFQEAFCMLTWPDLIWSPTDSIAYSYSLSYPPSHSPSFVVPLIKSKIVSSSEQGPSNFISEATHHAHWRRY